MIFVRCCACQKLLAKAGEFKNLQIKCVRCKTVNHFSLSVKNAISEVHETQNKKGARDDKDLQ